MKFKIIAEAHEHVLQCIATAGYYLCGDRAHRDQMPSVGAWLSDSVDDRERPEPPPRLPQTGEAKSSLANYRTIFMPIEGPEHRLLLEEPHYHFCSILRY